MSFFAGPKIVCAGPNCFCQTKIYLDIVPVPNFLCQTKRWFFLYLCLVLMQVPKCFVPVQIFWASPKMYLHIVAVTNILFQKKRWFAFSEIGFWAGTKVFEEALNEVKFLGWLKKFGLAQNILGPVKGQGISLLKTCTYGPYRIQTVTFNMWYTEDYVSFVKIMSLSKVHSFLKQFLTDLCCTFSKSFSWCQL